MPSIIEQVTAKPLIKEFAQGAAQSAAQPVASFLAPDVNVASMVFRYKKYSSKNRLRVPNTKRAYGGRATEIGYTAEDATANLEPRALDWPVDRLVEMEAQEVEDIVKEGATELAEIAMLDHEQVVVNKALEAGTAGKIDLAAGADVVAQLDDWVLKAAKAAKYGSIMGIRILYGADIFKDVKNHPQVKERIKGLATVVDETGISNMIIGKPDSRISFMVYDNAPEGKAEDIQFVLSDKIIVFACKDSPTRRDPSFMKTFRRMGQWMVPGAYSRDDGRVDVVKFDWTEFTDVTNAACGFVLTKK